MNDNVNMRVLNSANNKGAVDVLVCCTLCHCLRTSTAFYLQYNCRILTRGSCVSPHTLLEAAKYFKMVESLAPNEMLTKFATTAPKPVQEAAKSTIMNLLGNLPNYALDAALITTNTKLANLLYQMQMTGYMFKNAEYRMSLTRVLKGTVGDSFNGICWCIRVC